MYGTESLRARDILAIKECLKQISIMTISGTLNVLCLFVHKAIWEFKYGLHKVSGPLKKGVVSSPAFAALLPQSSAERLTIERDALKIYYWQFKSRLKKAK